MANSTKMTKQRVCVTRSEEQSPVLCNLLQKNGADVLALPLIEILPTTHRDVVDEILEQPGIYDWLVFTSANGVRHFFQNLYETCGDIRSIAFARIACVGKGTALAIRELRLRVDLVPPQSDAVSLAKALIATNSLDSARVLVLTGNRNQKALPRLLEEEGHAIVDVAEVYETRLKDLSNDPMIGEFRKKGADAILFTSGSTVESFIAQSQFLELQEGAKIPRAFSIGPITTKALKEAGIPVAAESPEATLEALVQCVLQHERL